MPIMEYYAGVNTLYMTLNIKQITKKTACNMIPLSSKTGKPTNYIYIDL